MERLLSVVEELLADDPARAKGVEREEWGPRADTAAAAAHGYLPEHEQPRDRIDHLLELNVHVQRIVDRQPKLPEALVTAIHATQNPGTPDPRSPAS